MNGLFPDQLVLWFVSFVPQNDLFEWVTVAQILAINCPIWNITARKKKPVKYLTVLCKGEVCYCIMAQCLCYQGMCVTFYFLQS